MGITNLLKKTEPNCCKKILENFEKTEQYKNKGEIINFLGVENCDVYNISHPFEIENRTVIAGRIENRGDWAKSKVSFFENKGGFWEIIEDAPVFPLEDAFATKVGTEIILGGVEVYTINNKFESNEIGYKTVFYKGKTFSSLKRFTCGPDKMKDIRIAHLPNGKILLCTRPQGGEFGRGKIGSVEIDNVEEINEENILKAKIIENLFLQDQWGGANELHILKDGRIGVLGHIAYEDKSRFKHYYAMSFIYNPQSYETTPIKIIATRKNFPKGEAKMPELEDVVFPGGLIRHNNGLATLYAGLSDAQAGLLTLPDPFENF